MEMNTPKWEEKLADLKAKAEKIKADRDEEEKITADDAVDAAVTSGEETEPEESVESVEDAEPETESEPEETSKEEKSADDSDGDDRDKDDGDEPTIVSKKDGSVYTNAVFTKDGQILSSSHTHDKIPIPPLPERPAHVSLATEVTKNMGDYNSLKLEVFVSVPVPLNDDQIDNASKYCEKKIEQIFDRRLAKLKADRTA